MRPGSPLIIDRPFVAYIPELIDALGGDWLDALIVQLLWYEADRDPTCEAIISYREMADRLRRPESTIRSHCARLRDQGILTSRRSSGYDSPNAWTVHDDLIGLAEPTADSERCASSEQIAASAPSARCEQTPPLTTSVVSYEGFEEPSTTTSPIPVEQGDAQIERAVTLGDCPPFPLIAEQRLATLGITEFAQWHAAWARVHHLNNTQPGVDYPPGDHLDGYLFDSRAKGHTPDAWRWEGFYRRRRLYESETFAAQAQAIQARSDWDEFEMRSNRMPARTYGPPEDQQ